MLVGCRRHGQSLQIGVYDTGVGIPVHKRGEIFKEFHRLEQGARIARGLGLGLSIVERLARVLNHGIAIDCQCRRRLGFLGDGADRESDQSHRGRHQRNAAVQDADERRADRVHRERSGDPRRHEDAADRMGRRGDRGGGSAKPPSGRSKPRAAVLPGCWSIITSTAATASPRSATSAAASATTFPAILITADRSPHVRAAAREENIAVLNKPVKPASLRALLGQWRAQQMVAAAE